jgi:hypothetical protein
MAAGWAAAAAAMEPAPILARASRVTDGETQSRGIVYVLRIKSGAGVAAVGSAASFERSELAHATRVEFHAGPAQQLIATSQALLAPPGWPASAGASAASPLLVYALDARPDGVTLLEPSVDPTPPAGTRVRVLGLSGDSGEPEERFGRIRELTPDRFEIEVDRPALTKDWAGAPVLLAGSDALIGTLEPDPRAPACAPGDADRLLVRELARPPSTAPAALRALRRSRVRDGAPAP